MSWATRISDGVSRCGEVRGQDDWSSRTDRVCGRCQAWNRLGDSRSSRRRARTGNASAGLIDGMQDSQLVPTLGQSLACQGEAGDAQPDESEPEQCRELPDALSEVFGISCGSSSSVRFATSRLTVTLGAVPPPRRRPRNAEISGGGQVSGALNELAYSVVVAFLRTAQDHATNHRLSGQRRSTLPR